MDTPLQNLAVIGAGAMGSGIAALFALKGLDVVLVDPMEGALDRARAVIERQLNVYAPGQVDAVMQRIRMAPGLDAAAACDLVIEAVPENLELKRGLFAQLDTLCKPEAIFATNTSGLSINAIASAVTRRDRFVGTHFFTPADVIPLVEVVRNDATSEDTVARVMATLRLGGKLLLASLVVLPVVLIGKDYFLASPLPLWQLILGCELVFLVYDYALTQIILLYLRKISGRI